MEKEIGHVTHFFSAISVAAISLTGTLKVGDKIRIKGANTDFEQKVDSMQIDRASVKEAKAGQEIGIKVKDKAKEKDIVYLVSKEEPAAPIEKKKPKKKA